MTEQEARLKGSIHSTGNFKDGTTTPTPHGLYSLHPRSGRGESWRVYTSSFEQQLHQQTPFKQCGPEARRKIFLQHLPAKSCSELVFTRRLKHHPSQSSVTFQAGNRIVPFIEQIPDVELEFHIHSFTELSSVPQQQIV